MVLCALSCVSKMWRCCTSCTASARSGERATGLREDFWLQFPRQETSSRTERYFHLLDCLSACVSNKTHPLPETERGPVERRSGCQKPVAACHGRAAESNGCLDSRCREAPRRELLTQEWTPAVGAHHCTAHKDPTGLVHSTHTIMYVYVLCVGGYLRTSHKDVCIGANQAFSCEVFCCY
jgi:hypothetical protein